MKLSVVIPAYNEEESLPETINSIYLELLNEKIDHEILVINDNSKDNTINVLNSLMTSINTLRHITNMGSNGFGYAVRKGLENFSGDCVAVMMADLSDSPQDLTRFYRTMVKGNYDCVFGSRFIKEGFKVPKQLINIKDKHLIDISLDCLNYEDCNLIFVVRDETVYNFHIDELLKKKFGEDIKIVIIDKLTDGSVSSCLYAEEYIDKNFINIYGFDPKCKPHIMIKNIK
jgi:dolichol-phosphate mannosyltransferase